MYRVRWNQFAGYSDFNSIDDALNCVCEHENNGEVVRLFCDVQNQKVAVVGGHYKFNVSIGFLMYQTNKSTNYYERDLIVC